MGHLWLGCDLIPTFVPMPFCLLFQCQHVQIRVLHVLGGHRQESVIETMDG